MYHTLQQALNQNKHKSNMQSQSQPQPHNKYNSQSISELISIPIPKQSIIQLHPNRLQQITYFIKNLINILMLELNIDIMIKLPEWYGGIKIGLFDE